MGEMTEKEGTEGGRWRDGEEAFVPGISPGTNVPPHLYRRTYTGSITGTNEGYEPVQMSIFPLVTPHTPFARRSCSTKWCGCLSGSYLYCIFS
jgi:hypothetical protein